MSITTNNNRYHSHEYDCNFLSLCNNFQRKMVEFLGTEIIFLLMIIKSSLEGLQRLAQLIDLQCFTEGLAGSPSEDGSTSRISIEDRQGDTRKCLSFCQPFYGDGNDRSFEDDYYEFEDTEYDDHDVYHSDMPLVGDGQMYEMAGMKSRHLERTEPENRLSFSYYGDVHAFCYLWMSLCGAFHQSNQIAQKKPRRKTSKRHRLVQTDDDDDSSARGGDSSDNDDSEAEYDVEDDCDVNDREDSDAAEDFESLEKVTDDDDYETAVDDNDNDIVEKADDHEGDVKFDVDDDNHVIDYEGDTVDSLSTATADS